jgi:GDP-L-galactose phosphorylase
MIVDRGARVFLIPQCYAERQAAALVEERFLDTQVNPACFEICGHLVMKRQADYDTLDENFSMELLAGCSLSEERFNDVIAMCVDQ